MEHELKELKVTIEKLLQHSHLHFKIVENEFKILRYEIQNKTIQSTFNIEEYMTIVKCRKCCEQKKVMKESCNAKCSICNDCGNTLIEEYDSDEEIC